MGSKKIVLISSGQPSLNPRLVKEADALAEAGYQVTVLYAYWNAWGTRYDTELLSQKKWKARLIGGAPGRDIFRWHISRLIYKLAQYMWRYNLAKSFAARFAVARSSLFLSYAAANHPADLYIAHNLGALPAAAKAAKATGKLYSFDAEDYHRGECAEIQCLWQSRLAEYLENKFLPGASYLSASSPMIAKRYSELYVRKVHCIRNVLPRPNGYPESEDNNKPIKLFWFSQTIGANRGLDRVLKALAAMNEKAYFELHLLGNVSTKVKEDIIRLSGSRAGCIFFYPPIPPDTIPVFARQFDIGIASEESLPVNRDICLTNKIFTYLTAGLAVLASDTSAQAAFMRIYPQIGSLYKQNDPESLSGQLMFYHSHREAIAVARRAAFKLAYAELCWEREQSVLLETVSTVLRR